jgi:hypothetical protein
VYGSKLYLHTTFLDTHAFKLEILEASLKQNINVFFQYLTQNKHKENILNRKGKKTKQNGMNKIY